MGLILMKPIIGDICGSIYEWQNPVKTPESLMNDACHFTDDTVCTCAIAEALIENVNYPDFDTYLKRYLNLYPHAGYGERFIKWCLDEIEGDSFGNGCCMRLFPISALYTHVNTSTYIRKALIAKSCSGSHNHPEAYAYASMLDDMIVTGNTWDDDLLTEEQWNFMYEYEVSVEDYAKTYEPDCTCKHTVPEAIGIGLCSGSFEDCIINAIELGGDTDTIATMACMVTDFSPSKELEEWAFNKLPKRLQNVVLKFQQLYDKVVNE